MKKILILLVSSLCSINCMRSVVIGTNDSIEPILLNRKNTNKVVIKNSYEINLDFIFNHVIDTVVIPPYPNFINDQSDLDKALLHSIPIPKNDEIVIIDEIDYFSRNIDFPPIFYYGLKIEANLKGKILKVQKEVK